MVSEMRRIRCSQVFARRRVSQIFSELKEDQEPHFYSFDFAPSALALLKQHHNFNESKITPFVCDIVKDELPSFIPVGQITCVVIIFVLSAISPDQFRTVEKKIYDVYLNPTT